MTKHAAGLLVFEFIPALIVLSFACRILLMLIGPPLRVLVMLLLMPLAGRKLDRASQSAIFVVPALLAILYAGFLSLITVRFAADTAPGSRWIFAACGGAAALFSLISYSLGLSAKGETHIFGPRPDDRLWRITAKISLAVGLAAFVFFYRFPNLILTLPGAGYFFDQVFLLAAWLNSYKAVQVILVAGIIIYFAVSTAAVLYQLISEAVDWLKVKVLGLVRRY